jgi:hypothetical protein
MSVLPMLYTIRVDGNLGPIMLGAFPGLVAEHQAAETLLTGYLDRSGLYGVLAHMEMLGVDLVDVHRVGPPECPTGQS